MTKINFDTNIKKIVIKEFDSFEIKLIKLYLDNTADITIIIYNTENDLENIVENISIQGVDYDNWKNDDTYIKNYVKNYLQNKYSS